MEASQYLKSIRQEVETILLDFKRRAREAEAPKWHEIEEMQSVTKGPFPTLGSR